MYNNALSHIGPVMTEVSLVINANTDQCIILCRNTNPRQYINSIVIGLHHVVVIHRWYAEAVAPSNWGDCSEH